MTKNVLAKIGPLAQNAMQRRKDTDLLTVLDSGTSLAGAGVTLTAGHVRAATSRSRYGANVEPPTKEGYIVLQAYQLKDLEDEITAGIGTYTIPAGLSDEVFKKGFAGTIDSFNIFVDNNISIDSADDAKGGVFTRDTIVLVQGHGMKTEIERMPRLGGGADSLVMYNEYGSGVRLTNSLFELYSDATAGTS